MNKNILKNSWVLAIMIVISASIINFLINLFIGIGIVMVAIATLAAAMFAGQIYTIAFNDVMPKILRLKTAVNYLCIQIALSISLIFAFGFFEIWALALMIGAALIASAVVYWAIGFGGRIQLKALEKRK